MPRKPKTTASHTPVASVRHKDKRANIPTSELRDFVADDEKAPKSVLYPRDPSLDPQLVWKGKDEQDSEDLAVPCVPVYIQEKIHPQALIENLRAGSAGVPPALTLFDDFNGSDTFEKKIDFYRWPMNWSNRMIFGDSLLGMTSTRLHAEWWNLRRERQQQIDASIARRADTELLYDQPYEDNKWVRVTGPFTVESLSPHRVLSPDDPGSAPGSAGVPPASAAKPPAATATKILHKKRPALLPMLDSLLEGHYCSKLKVRAETYGGYAVNLMKLFRTDLLAVLPEVTALCAVAAERRRPVTPVRMLDHLLWSQLSPAP